MERRLGVTGLGLDAVLPTIGSKELIASLPTHLGVGPGDLVVHPELAYPTYEVGAMLAGARTLAADSLTAIGPEVPRLLWLNSPANPTGRVLPGRAPPQGRRLVPGARHGPRLRRVLHRAGLGGRAGLRAAPRRLRRLRRRASWRCTRCPSGPTWPATAARSSPATPPWSASCSPSARTSACRCPGPQQVAMAAALADDAHVDEQRERYAAPAGRAAARPGGRRVPDRPLRGVALPLGDPGRGLLGDRRVRWPSAGSWSRRAPSTARPGASTCGSPSPRPTSGSPPRRTGCDTGRAKRVVNRQAKAG